MIKLSTQVKPHIQVGKAFLEKTNELIGKLCVIVTTGREETYSWEVDLGQARSYLFSLLAMHP